MAKPLTAAPHHTDEHDVSTASTSFGSLSAHPRPHSLLPLTFGLEIEYLFAKLASIDIPSSLHRLYTLSPTHDGDLATNQSADFVIRRDVLAIYQAALLISERTGKELWRFPFPPEGITYEKWHITGELMANLKDEQHAKLPQWTHGTISASQEDIDRWIFMGQEMVSRIFNVPDIGTRCANLGPDMAEVRQFLNALSSRPTDDCLFISEVDNASVHVHIGLPPTHTSTNDGDGLTITSQGFNLKLLQHLAYITFEFEHIISLFHDPRRRGFWSTKTMEVAEPNRFGVAGHKHQCGLYPLPALRRVHELIFSRSMTVQYLARLMGNASPSDLNTRPTGDRMKFVNWTNIMRSDGKCTIEFRQHHGTSNADDIEQWIVFVTSLVRAAERKALHDITPNISPTSSASTLSSQLQWSMRQGRKYCTRYENEEDQMEKLFDLLEMRNSRRTYWRNRATKYKGAEYTRHDWYESCIQCLVGTTVPDLRIRIDMAIAQVLRVEADMAEANQDLASLQASLSDTSLADEDRNVIKLQISNQQRSLRRFSRELKDARSAAAAMLTLIPDTMRVKIRTARIWHDDDDHEYEAFAREAGLPPILRLDDNDPAEEEHDARLLQIIQDRLNDPDCTGAGPSLTQTLTQDALDRFSRMLTETVVDPDSDSEDDQDIDDSSDEQDIDSDDDHGDGEVALPVGGEDGNQNAGPGWRSLFAGANQIATRGTKRKRNSDGQ